MGVVEESETRIAGDKDGAPITVHSSKVVEEKKKSRGCGTIIAILLLGMVLAAALVATLVYYNTLPARKELQWYHKTVIYQIYPRSFQDSNGDGMGDLKGITDRLDYLKELGITTVWLSPIYDSPMDDFGYDIANFTGIWKEFGTDQDFDKMMEKATENGIKIIMDFVPNHSSNKNMWFQESIKRHPRYDNYYIWHDGVKINETYSAPPNNWRSVFGDSAWEWNAERKQFYYHAFLKTQPDLNWRNPNVTEEMDNVLISWLDRKVAGFRVDAIPYMFEVEDMIGADENERNPYEMTTGLRETDYDYWLHPKTMNLPETVNYTKHWIDLMNDYTAKNGGDPKFLIFEVVNKNISETIRYYPDNPFETAAMPFYFGLILHLHSTSTGYDIERSIRTLLDKLPAGGWPSWVIGNHDNRRATNRLGNPALIDALNMLNLLLPGTPTTYYGEEIGMQDLILTNNTQIKDPYAINFINVDNSALNKTRDYERGPMQWNNSLNAGFSTNDSLIEPTWLPLGPGWNTTINVQYQKEKGRRSHYGVYKDLLRIRKSAPFQQGQFRTALVTNEMFSFVREYGNVQYLVAIDLRRDNSLDTVAYDFTKFHLQGTARIAVASVNVYESPKNNSLSKLNELQDNVDLSSVYLEPSAGVVLRISDTH